MLTKIGFLLDNCGPNQLAYQLIRSINSTLLERDDFDPIIYYRNVAPFVVRPNFAVMNMFEAYRPNSALVATDLNSAQRILEYFTLDRYFLLWDLEWTKGSRNYEQLSDVYQNPKLKIITRSIQHKNLFELAWGRTVEGVIEDANINQFLSLIRGLETSSGK